MQREIAAQPFVDWLAGELARAERIHAEDGGLAPAERVCELIGWPAGESSVRKLWRFRKSLRAGSRNAIKGDYPTETFPRDVVEDALTAAGVDVTDVYPELTDRQPRFPRSWCSSCRETVIAMPDGTCAWCSTQTLAKDGPYGECACGCGETIRLFDQKNRPVRWRRGHAPRSLEQPKPPVPAAPFVQFIRRDVLPGRSISEAAVELGLSRQTLSELLRGTGYDGSPKRVVERKTVQRALRKWGSLGKGRPWREGAPNFTELYGQLVCPDCGGKKARAARRCKPCSGGRRRRRTGAQVQAVKLRSNVKMTRYTLGEAHRMHVEEGLSLREISSRLIHRTGYSSAQSMAMALADQFRKQGWPVRSQGDATAEANVRRGWRPQCEHVHKLGKKKGEQCARRSQGEATEIGPRCWHHHPDRIADGIVRLRAAA